MSTPDIHVGPVVGQPATVGTVHIVPVRGGGGSGGGSSGGHSSGGGGYSGGSGGSIGGGSGGYTGVYHSPNVYGGGGDGPSFGDAGLAVFALVLGVPLLIVAAYIAYKVWSGRDGGSGDASLNTVSDLAADDPAGARRVPASLVAGYNTLVDADPDFDAEKFDEAARRVFHAVQTAWCDQDTSATRKVMADGLWQAHRQQIDGYAKSGRHNMLDGLAIQYTFVQSISRAGDDEHITVRFFADSADYDVDADGKKVSGSKSKASWCEDWVFARAATATTRPDGGIASARCPNCGAPLDVDTLGNCAYCHAAIMGGAHDWVLLRIDQLSSLEDGWYSRGALPSALSAERPS